MKRTVRSQIKSPYTLHDMNVIAFECTGDELILRTQSGLVQTTIPFGQPDGYVEFHGVKWDSCYVYLLGVTGSTGTFTGEKLFLKDFLTRFPSFGFSIMDETYGYNRTRYCGYLLSNRRHHECILEICHEGDMVFVENTEYSGMREVILSHDSEAVVYSVPAAVAADLEAYCMDFAANWVWHGPENGKFLRRFGENQFGAVFGAADFIAYLNTWVFPDQPSQPVAALGCWMEELPDAYRSYPKYNF